MVLMFGTQSVTFWYPTPFPQPRTLVRPPNPCLPLSLTLKGSRGGSEGKERAPLRDHHVSPATTSHVRRTSFRRTDRPLPPVASRRSRVGTRDQYNNQRRSASAPRVAPPRLRGRSVCEKQLTTTPLYVGDSYSVGVFVHTVILWDKVALSAYSESAS